MMRVVSAEEAVAGIQSGDQVFVHGAAATPTALLEALAARAGTLRDVGVVHLHTEGPAPHLAPAMAGHLRHRALFIGANARAAVAEGRAEYIPVFLSDIPALIARGKIRVDVALLNLTPPDRHGFCSLGPSVDVAVAAARTARTVIALLNPALPRTHGDGFVHISRVDYGVELRAAPHQAPPQVIDAVERRIGERVAGLVPPGATLQLGIGAIPDAVAAALVHHRDLGIHSEMFTDVVVDLVERGVVTGTQKEINPGKIVAAFVAGTQRLYDFVDDNPLVELRPADYTNDSAIIRRFRRMTAINSAVEIDLTGQVCADSIGHRLLSGVGGQMDFIRGAALAEDGRAIIALPSTAARGSCSRIVVALRPGAGVVTTRAHVETVVTEHGVAELVGRSIPERARALIGLAEPRFRDELSAAARAAGV
ncbi:MAG: acetyl-CoA hydrolase/transferase family protein, partial [Candidatus Binatia bacterium]